MVGGTSGWQAPSPSINRLKTADNLKLASARLKIWFTVELRFSTTGEIWHAQSIEISRCNKEKMIIVAIRSLQMNSPWNEQFGLHLARQ